MTNKWLKLFTPPRNTSQFSPPPQAEGGVRCIMSSPPETRAALLALLDWYVESGVDLALDEAPHDRYADSARASVASLAEPADPVATPLPQPSAAERPRRAAVPIVAPDEAIRAAEQEAADARDLDDLAARLAEFAHAPFRDMAQHFLFGAGAARRGLSPTTPRRARPKKRAAKASAGSRRSSSTICSRRLASIAQALRSPMSRPGDRQATKH